MKRGPKTNFCQDQEYVKSQRKKKYVENIDQERARARAKNASNREDALTAYGHQCQCDCGCKENRTPYLTFDHIHNDGAAHRRSLGHKGAGCQFIHWLKNNAWPKDIVQILCSNCNHAKAFYGGCPRG